MYIPNHRLVFSSNLLAVDLGSMLRFVVLKNDRGTGVDLDAIFIVDFPDIYDQMGARNGLFLGYVNGHFKKLESS